MNQFFVQPRHQLFAVSGFVWLAVGIMLCWKAIGWLSLFDVQTEFFIESSGIAIAGACYWVGFSKITKRNIARIYTLPYKVSIFQFTALKGYIMILLMIAIGITLRSSTIPKHCLSIPYTAMGGSLFLGSLKFFREFILVSRQLK